MDVITTFSHRHNHIQHEPSIVPLERKKIVIIGDKSSGKTSLLRAFTQEVSPVEYIPKILEYALVDVRTAGKDIELALWNTAGQEHFDRLCSILYPDADAILLCFSFDKPETLDSVVNKWYPEIQKRCKNVSIILVGNKVDLRYDFQLIKTLRKIKKAPVRSSEAKAVADGIKAFSYVECSAKTHVGVNEVFHNAVRAIVSPKRERKRSSRLFFHKNNHVASPVC
uniref:Ras-like GTP-binding protein rhoA n=1 Tax=Diabrotica virgifera virgifera TaxID=50390 RepID=A0A6P7G6G9_DIAVI